MGTLLPALKTVVIFLVSGLHNKVVEIEVNANRIGMLCFGISCSWLITIAILLLPPPSPPRPQRMRLQKISYMMMMM